MGTLYIVATPIGNLEDISLRAARTLLTVPVVACEDTRRAGILLSEIAKLFSGYQEVKKPKLISFYDEVEEKKVPEIVAILESGLDVALISDAGTPGISDPGYKLIRECIARNIALDALPGPSAVITSLVVSGLPTDKFLFLGYPPKKEGHRNEFWEKIKESGKLFKTTVILYEAPHRIKGTIEEMIVHFGKDQKVVFARELTKTYEEVLRDSLENLQTHFEKNEPRGEFVILLQVGA